MDNSIRPEVRDIVANNNRILLHSYRGINNPNFTEMCLMFPRLTDGAKIAVLKHIHSTLEELSEVSCKDDFILWSLPHLLQSMSVLLANQQRRVINDI